MRKRTPTILQMQAIDSGVVSLAIILEHHGRVEPIWRIREASGLDPNGSTLEGLVLAGEGAGLECAARRVDAEDLASIAFPSLIGWDRSRFVVLEGRDRRGWWINDPARGASRVPDEDFRSRFAGTVIECRRGPSFRKGGRRPSLASGLRRLLDGSGAAIAAGVIASTSLVIVLLAGAGLLTYIIDVLLVDRRLDRIPPFILASAVIFGLWAMLQFVQAQATNRLSTLVSVRNKVRLLRHVTRIPDAERRLRSSADLAQRLPLIRQMASGTLPQLVLLPSNLFSIAVFGTAIFIISWQVAICIAASIAVGLLITRLVAHRIYTLNVRNQVEIGLQRSTLFAGLGVRDWLQESGGIRVLLDLWLGHMSTSRRLGQDRGHVQLMATSGRGLVNQLVTQIGTLVLGGLGVIQGTMTIGELAALQALAGSLQASVTAVLGVAQSIPTIRSTLARIDDLLEIPVSDDADASSQGVIDPDGTVELTGIPLDDGAVLDGTVRPGGLVAVRGLDKDHRRRVGAGIAGALRHRGCSARVLSGRIELFPGTLAENVSGFDPHVSTTLVAEAVESVGLGPLVRRHPSGLLVAVREDQPFGDEGEEMRLELATILVSPPSVVVVPERPAGATSADDLDAIRMIRDAGAAVILLDADEPTPDDCMDVAVRSVPGGAE